MNNHSSIFEGIAIGMLCVISIIIPTTLIIMGHGTLACNLMIAEGGITIIICGFKLLSSAAQQTGESHNLIPIGFVMGIILTIAGIMLPLVMNVNMFDEYNRIETEQEANNNTNDNTQKEESAYDKNNENQNKR